MPNKSMASSLVGCFEDQKKLPLLFLLLLLTFFSFFFLHYATNTMQNVNKHYILLFILELERKSQNLNHLYWEPIIFTCIFSNFKTLWILNCFLFFFPFFFPICFVFCVLWTLRIASEVYVFWRRFFIYWGVFSTHVGDRQTLICSWRK